MCADDQVAKVSRVDAFVETSAFPRLKSKRRLQSTVSEAGTAHEVCEHSKRQPRPSIYIVISSRRT